MQSAVLALSDIEASNPLTRTSQGMTRQRTQSMVTLEPDGKAIILWYDDGNL